MDSKHFEWADFYHYRDGMTTKDIAEIRGISRQAIDIRIRKIHKKFYKPYTERKKSRFLHYENAIYRNSDIPFTSKRQFNNYLSKNLESKFIDEIAHELGCFSNQLEELLEMKGYEIIEASWDEEKERRREENIRKRNERWKEELIVWGKKRLKKGLPMNPSHILHNHVKNWSRIKRIYNDKEGWFRLYLQDCGTNSEEVYKVNYPIHRKKRA